MQNQSSKHPLYRRVSSVVVAFVSVLAASTLLARTELGSDGSVIPAAPPAIAEVTGPTVEGSGTLDAWNPTEALSLRSTVEFPPPPAVDVEAIRASARAWLGDGVMTAPTDDIQIAAPDVATIEDLVGPSIDVPALERPELPALPPIR